MTIDYATWVRRANSRWIVHHGLSANAEAYLDYLARRDPKRLLESCRHAYRLTHERPPEEDPKPWFYGGVFSLATAAEIREFLSGHWLLRMVLTGSPGDLAQNPAGQAISAPTLRKIEAVRQAVARIRGQCGGD
jgi:hypothetical protein